MASMNLSLNNAPAIDHDDSDQRIDTSLRTCPSIPIFYQEIAAMAKEKQKLQQCESQEEYIKSKEKLTTTERKRSISDLSDDTTNLSCNGSITDFDYKLLRPVIILENLKEWPYCPIKRAMMEDASEPTRSHSSRILVFKTILDQNKSAAHHDDVEGGKGQEMKRRRRTSLLDELDYIPGCRTSDGGSEKEKAIQSSLARAA